MVIGHLSRKKNLNITRGIVQGKPEGKRGQGRTRMRIRIYRLLLIFQNENKIFEKCETTYLLG